MRVPKRCIIVLCGMAGSGKSTFAMKNFKPTEIVSSDHCRAMVSDEEGDMSVSREAFDLFYTIIEKRMKNGRLIVADSTALSYDARRKLIKLAEKYDYYSFLIAFDIPLELAQFRNSLRERKVPEDVIKRQYEFFKSSLKHLHDEDFDQVLVLKDEEISSFILERTEISESQDFDIISDVHGCFDELKLLLKKLGYQKDGDTYKHPNMRKIIFAGDIAGIGPRSIDTIELVYNMVMAKDAYYIPGDYCYKFYKYLKDKKSKADGGLKAAVDEYKKLDKYKREQLRKKFIKLYEDSPLYLILDEGSLIVSHAGIKSEILKNKAKGIRDFVLFGEESNGQNSWVSEYHGDALIVYGHIPVKQPVFINNTVDIDMGAAFLGALAALRYPEREIVSVSSLKNYSLNKEIDDKSINYSNFTDYINTLSFKCINDETIDKYEIDRAVKILKSIPVDPSWIVYIPPFIPSVNSLSLKKQMQDILEYYRKSGVKKLIIEKRYIERGLVFVICRDSNISKTYFNSLNIGEAYSFHNNIPDDYNHEMVESIQSDLMSSRYFEDNNIDFLVFEAYLDRDKKIVPIKLICDNRFSMFDKDNLWQIENINRLCAYSNALKEPDILTVKSEEEIGSVISNIIEQGFMEFVVMPEKSNHNLKDIKLQPEILCSSEHILCGEGYFEKSILSHELISDSVKNFVKNKLSKEHFQYIIGCVAINCRIYDPIQKDVLI